MIIYTETEVSHLDQMYYLPLNKPRIEMYRMEDWLKEEGHIILEEYRYDKMDFSFTVIGIKSETR